MGRMGRGGAKRNGGGAGGPLAGGQRLHKEPAGVGALHFGRGGLQGVRGQRCPLGAPPVAPPPPQGQLLRQLLVALLLLFLLLVWGGQKGEGGGGWGGQRGPEGTEWLLGGEMG